MGNKIFILFTLFFLTSEIYSQFDCSIINPRTTGNIPDANNYIPGEDTPIKYIRINVHFMLKEQGTLGYPGNFTKVNDGNGNSDYTGYEYANDLINKANERLSANYKMKMPPGNSTVVLPRKYQYILSGVFFHEDNYFYTFSYNAPTLYSETAEDAINLFLNHTNNGIGGGMANMSSNRYVVIKGAWEGYLSDTTPIMLYGSLVV